MTLTRSGREVVGSYGSYDEARQAVSALAAGGFPIRRSRIVGEDVRLVEYVTGRQRLWAALAESAAVGGVIGGLLTLVLGLFDVLELTISTAGFVVWGLVVGLVAGALIGLIGFAFSRGRSDFSSVATAEASRYLVEVASARAADARAILEGRSET
jgi:hypothetical protein